MDNQNTQNQQINFIANLMICKYMQVKFKEFHIYSLIILLEISHHLQLENIQYAS